MRKTLLFLSVIGLLMTSCEKDNDDNDNQNSEDSTAVDSTDLTNSEDSSSDISGIGTYPDGTVHCNGTPTAIVDVTNPTTGKTWMDRNLGASQAATSSTDSLAYGDLYQWGRGADGHQCRNSSITDNLSSTDEPIHGYFISTWNSNWRSPKNDFLWQGVNGANNPCPDGYRLPTREEWEEERATWVSDDSDGAFASPLKLPMSGTRYYDGGSLRDVGTYGYYWSSTVDGTPSNDLYFYSNSANMNNFYRASGSSVRCLKD